MKIMVKVAWALARLAWFLAKLLWFVARVTVRPSIAVTGMMSRRFRRGVTYNTSVHIRRDWNDHRVGTVRWADLRSPRWDTVSGGEQNRTPQPFIHAFVWCSLVNGDIAHSCIHGPPPHDIKVCLVRKDNNRDVWNRLSEIAGPKPGRRRTNRR